jgi:hypothetical protein
LFLWTRKSDECIVATTPRKGEQAMRYYTIDGENNIAVNASRKDARKTGKGLFSTEKQFARPDRPRPQAAG